MKTIIVAAIILGATTLPSALIAQAPNPLSFFPHHPGDVWEYVNAIGPPTYWQNRIMADSSGTDGRAYIHTSLFGLNILDSVSRRVYRSFNGNDTLLQYNLDAAQGNRWTVFRSPSTTRLAQVVGVYDAFVLDTIVQVKEIDYTDSASGLLLLTDYIASGFGLIGQDIDGFPDSRIRGVRINGVQHGIITFVRETQFELPGLSFVLRQNYPNPFNPSTTFEYELSEGSDIELILFDVQGKEVRSLVRGYKPAGPYRQQLDANGLSSGVYIYSLKTRFGVKSRRMLLLR